MKSIQFTLLIFGSIVLSAQKYPQPIYSDDGIAIDGYDPVAYFESNNAIKGDKKYSFVWKETTWYFSSSKNRDSFKANPEKYAPQYGGYCAWGMSQGYKAKVDPENAWTITNGKLYLNYSTGIKTKWLPKKEELIKTADANWKKFE